MSISLVQALILDRIYTLSVLRLCYTNVVGFSTNRQATGDDS